MALSKYFVNIYKYFCRTSMETMRIQLIIMFMSMDVLAHEAILLGCVPRNTRHIEFPQVDG